MSAPQDRRPNAPPGHHRLPLGASGALRTFAGWVARGTVGHPLVDDVDYWSVLREEPSLMETAFAIFANVLILDEEGNPTNPSNAERRAAMWIRQYCTGVPAEPPIESWEAELW